MSFPSLGIFWQSRWTFYLLLSCSFHFFRFWKHLLMIIHSIKIIFHSHNLKLFCFSYLFRKNCLRFEHDALRKTFLSCFDGIFINSSNEFSSWTQKFHSSAFKTLDKGFSLINLHFLQQLSESEVWFIQAWSLANILSWKETPSAIMCCWL